jgi:glutamine synthetase
MSMPFIERHGLWTEEQRRRAEEIRRRVEADKLRYVRLAWGDTHGYARAKTLTIPALLSALSSGHNIGVATTTLDSAGARVFASFTRGGGMGIEQMTGSPNITAVPDPATFRVLPWAPGTGWILCDEYFNDGTPFPFSTRQLLRKALQRLAERGHACVVGAEIEWYLLRVADGELTDENIGVPGTRGKPVRTVPVEPGYHYYSESAMDLMQPVFDALGDAYETLGLGLRSIENEWGPGQVECTFAPARALEAADNVFLFRTATRQICRRLGYFATFMCRPALKGFYASGWHLHQSLVDAASGANLLAPTNATWARDHRGAMLRVLGGEGDPASRIENRVGEPSANPYLYILSQVVAGLAGIEAGLTPPPADTEPYAAERPRLPQSLTEALDALDREPLFRAALGDTFIDYFVKLKRTEAGRCQRALDEAGGAPGDEPTAWEQNEYFDFF